MHDKSKEQQNFQAMKWYLIKFIWQLIKTCGSHKIINPEHKNLTLQLLFKLKREMYHQKSKEPKKAKDEEKR